MKKVTLFILNYNGIEEIKSGSLASIACAANHIKGYEISVVYLDNFSNDGSTILVKNYFPHAVVASTFFNCGYVKGTNIGIQLGWKLFHPDYYILIDSDNFCDESAYSRLLDYAEQNSDVAMVQPKVVSTENHEAVLSCGHTFRESGGTLSITDPNGVYDLNNLLSCSISSTLFKSFVFEEIGLLNEKFEMYYESSDISFRIRKAGYRCACCPDAVAYNERLKPMDFKCFRKYYVMRRNLFLFWRLHDSEEFQRIKKWWEEKAIEYQSFYEKQEFITDYQLEAERRALNEIPVIERTPLEELKVIPKIEDFNKNDILLIDRF